MITLSKLTLLALFAIISLIISLAAEARSGAYFGTCPNPQTMRLNENHFWIVSNIWKSLVPSKAPANSNNTFVSALAGVTKQSTNDSQNYVSNSINCIYNNSKTNEEIIFIPTDKAAVFYFPEYAGWRLVNSDEMYCRSDDFGFCNFLVSRHLGS